MINVIVLLIICVLKLPLTYLDVRIAQNVTPKPNFFSKKEKKDANVLVVRPALKKYAHYSVSNLLA